MVYQKWPYDHAPFLGYWDSYDNKLAMILEEPYSRLALTMAMTYLIWLRINIYARKHHVREKRAEGVSQNGP